MSRRAESAPRLLWADALRSLCCLMIVALHVSAADWHTLPTGSADFWAATAVGSLTHPAVPVFFMLSGAFLLDRDPEPLPLLRRTGRLALLWAAMSAFYALELNGLGILRRPVYFLSLLLQSRYHLWFLRTLVCLYLLVPVLRALVVWQEGRWVPWLLGVFLVFGVLRQTMGLVPVDARTWQSLRQVFVPELCQYSGYFLLGWYLTRARPVPKWRPRVYMLALVLTWGVTLLGTWGWSVGAESNDERMYAYLGLPVLVMSLCLFRLAQTRRETGVLRALARLSPLTLGIYVWHPLTIDLLLELGIRTDWPRLLYIPAMTIPAFVLAGLLTRLLHGLRRAIGKIIEDRGRPVC